MTNGQSNTNTANNTITCEECGCTPSLDHPRFTQWFGTNGDVTEREALHWWCNECMGYEQGFAEELDECYQPDVRATYEWTEDEQTVG